MEANIHKQPKNHKETEKKQQKYFFFFFKVRRKLWELTKQKWIWSISVLKQAIYVYICINVYIYFYNLKIANDEFESSAVMLCFLLPSLFLFSSFFIF